jgi:hypothetical protein
LLSSMSSSSVTVNHYFVRKDSLKRGSKFSGKSSR